MKRGGGKHLDDEDEALWSHVTRHVRRMSPGTARATPHHNPAPIERPREQPTSKSNHRPPPLPPLSVRASTPPLAAIEPRKVKRVVRGRDEIDARIDLHGMRQVEAHGALRAFLHRAYHNGCRMVLVITGKGRDSDDDHRHAPFDMFQDRDRGVLRRNLPRWLAEPDLRAIVVGHTSANIRHGGDGAFYVQLRNPEKFRG